MLKPREQNKASHERKGLSRKARQALRLVVVALLLLAALAMALVVGDASYHATPVGWVPLVALVFLIALSWGYVKLAAKRLVVGQLASLADCKRGEELPFSLTIENRMPFPLFGAKLRFAISDGDGQARRETEHTASLAPFQRDELAFAASFEHVGRFKAGIDCLVVSDFLGLFERELSCPRCCEVCVTPNLVPIAQVRFEAQEAEDVPRPQKAVLADSMDYAYVRPYEVGDTLKTVHWKLSARTEELQTRLYEQTVSPGVAVVLDLSVPKTSAAAQLDLIDCVVESGLSIARYAQAQGIECEVHYVDMDGELCCLRRIDKDTALRFVESMPVRFTGAEQERSSERLLEGVCAFASRMPNLVVCTANLNGASLGNIAQAMLARKSPLVIACVPPLLVDAARERFLAPVSQLSGLGVSCTAISHADELSGAAL